MQEQRKASNTTTSEIVLESLREQIINGTLQPQEKLVEAEIAQKFGLSRGPVREALRQLAFEGLVDYCPNKGCTVALLSPQDAYEVFFLRGSLEKLAIQKSNCRLSDYSLMIMEASIEDFRKAVLAGNTMKAVHADETFHLQIIHSAQLNRLTKMWELLSPLNGAMFLSVQNANRLNQTHRIQVPLIREVLQYGHTNACWRPSGLMISRQPVIFWISIMKKPADVYTDFHS